MGFTELRLVNTTAHQDEKASWLAHGSHEVLMAARHFDCLQDAIADLDFVIATSAKSRSVNLDHYSPEQARELVNKKQNTIENIGIVFGKEERGLANEDIRLCDAISYIPMKRLYPSLNLAQAVMLYAYVFSSFNFLEKKNEKYPKPGTGKWKKLKNEVAHIISNTGIAKNENLSGRIMERLAVLNDDDVNLLLSVCHKIKEQFGKVP